MEPREQFCPNMDCPARGKVGENNIFVQSRKEARYQCKMCRKTFAATTGTPIYRRHHRQRLIVIVATLIAHSCPLQAIVAAFQLDERTVMDWQKRAGRHAQRVHEHLAQQPRDLEHVQADEIRVKGQGKVVWLAMAIMVSTRLWLGGVAARKRDDHLILSLMQIIRQCALAYRLLTCVDGFIAYVQAVQQVFRSPLPSRKRGRPWLISWSDIHIDQVIKHYQGKRVVDVTRCMQGLS
jgi:transposase-like protein